MHFSRTLVMLATAALASAGSFPHSDHRAPLVKRQVSPGVKELAAGLRRRATPDFRGLNVTVAEAPTANNTIGFDIQGDQRGIDDSYFAEVEIGTPPTTYSLIIDTGSSDLWVPGEACVGCNHVTLGSKSSSTFVAAGDTWNITYGTGQAQGIHCTDTVSLAGYTLENHRFGVVESSSAPFNLTSTAMDGILGTGRSFGSQQFALTVPEAILARQLGGGITGYRLGRTRDGVNDGEITFGGVDTEAFVEPLVEQYNLLTDGHWGMLATNVSAGGKDLGLGSRGLILDTGTTQLIIPAADAAALHAQIPHSQGPDASGIYLIPCKTDVTFALTISGTDFSIDPRDLILDEIDTADPEGYCQSGIAESVSTADLDPLWLVGDVFLKNVYYATSIADNKVALAHLADSATATDSSSKTARRRIRW